MIFINFPYGCRPEFDEIVTRLEDIIVEVQAGTFDDSDTGSCEGETGRVTPPLKISKKSHRAGVRGQPKELNDVAARSPRR